MQLTTDNVKDKVSSLAARVLRAEGALATLAQRKTELTTSIAQAKARQALQEEMQHVFQLLQERAHERSVGAFERLLSAILNDVLPDEGHIRLGLSIKNNTPALDVLLQKGEKLEDVYDGNGGGVTNIVCAGLRFAALSRTKNRRFMVLDEPDGWLGLDQVSPFVKVLSDVSTATSTQTVFISHRPPEYFDGLVNLVELRRQPDGSPAAVLRQPAVTKWTSDEEPGIRAIELINVRRHRHTVLPLLPGATALIGDVNLGKSTAVIAAMKAVCYGESSDSLIMHDADEARIVLHLEKGKRLLWSRKPGRSPVVVYELYEGAAAEPSVKGRPGKRNEAPDWVQELMGITRVDDLDIQLGNQKRPVFLLDDTASRRAQILSVGRESSHLPALMKEWDAVKAEDREMVRAGEAELMRVGYRLQAETSFTPTKKVIEEFAVRFSKVEELLRRAELLDGIVKVMAEVDARLQVLGDAAQLPALPKLPELPDSAELKRLVDELSRISLRAEAFGEIAKVPAVPTLPDSSELLALGQALKRATEALRALDAVPDKLPSAPALPESAELATLLTALSQQSGVVQKLDNDLTVSKRELDALAAEKAQLIEESGGLCPLCGHEMDESALEGHSHA
jgi:hypothetical protein